MLDSEIDPRRCKLHLAGWNGATDPLDEYLADRFEEWQIWQSKRNFERDIVVALIAMPSPDRWLFAGAYDSRGSSIQRGDGEKPWRVYDLARRPAVDELDGRLIARFRRAGRQSYLVAERWSDALLVDELRPEKLRIREFPGYASVSLTKAHLDIIVREEIESWRAALSHVAGVYVITDRTNGKLYIGSATSGEGIWSRWKAYSATGHGGNKDLKRLLSKNGPEHAQNFQFGVLEIADTHASKDDVLAREGHWKRLLLSREHGYNAN